MILTKNCLLISAMIVAAFFANEGQAQTAFSEDFTGSATSNQWYFFNGACLTAGTGTSTNSPGYVPGCTTIGSSYYGQNLVGGQNGVSGSTQTLPDSSGYGALRFTNGYPYGYSQNGAIVSKDALQTGQGIQVTFKTVTYRGNSGGAGGDGADGISFYLMDGSQPAGIGAWGGSLGYSCSNTNTPYNGLGYAYIGLGIDEYGNFLNGTSLMSGYAGSNTASGDNTALGYGYKPGRIGLRGAGNVSWNSLTGLYGTNPSSSTKPYYPASLASTCTSGSYDSASNSCPVCSAGSYSSSSGACVGICSSGTYSSTTNTCVGATPSCSSGSGTYDSTTMLCEVCPSGYTYQQSPTNNCKKSGTIKSVTSTYSPTYATPTTASPSSYGTLYSLLAVQKTCSTGNLWNYSTASSPTSAGAATLGNAANTQKVLDYAPIPNAYKELSGVTIANESAMKRSDANVIFYNLKVTQDGLLSLSYSYNGGAYLPVITNQSITASNGALPSSFRFGFAGSTGGSSNIHEIMCFKASSANESGSSTVANEKEAAKITSTTQAYFASYNPNNWTGDITANTLIDNAGIVSIRSTANWDAQCNLTGVPTGSKCSTTGVAGATAAQSPSSRVMLTWDGSQGIPFEWSNLSSSQQSALDTGDATATANRLNYLRGDRSNEITSLGAGTFRARDGVLGDIVDSSPSWVGPPSSPYTATWTDRLHPTATMPENLGTQNYLQFTTAKQTRLNVIYGGANDGFLHGFRTGSFDVNGNFVDSSTTPNDGKEVLAYMPGAVLQSSASSSTSLNCANSASTQSLVQNIHGVTPAIGSSAACVNTDLDYSNTQYGHNFFVDASPGTGDLFYGGTWHTWLVSGLGAGGAAIFALDITDPSATNFSEGNAASLVKGEWTSATISCANVSNCGQNLGNTYGTPQIHRLHGNNGQWGVIFGNGFGSTSGDAGIYVMTIDQSSGATTFYYLSTNTANTGNGIAYVTPADLDGDHITDYVYAGDLKGNVWRFDLTDTNPSNWTAASSPLFTTPSGQPITSQLLAVAAIVTGSQPQVMIEFGTGKRTQLTNTNPVSFAAGMQAIYGVWDWNLGTWNAAAPNSQYLSLPATGAATGLSSPYTLNQSNLEQQTFSIQSGGIVEGTSNAVCWQGTTTCSSGNNQFGWYATLPNSSGSASVYEQAIFNPVFYQGAFIIDSFIPANNIPTSCTSNADGGYTYVVGVGTGGVLTTTTTSTTTTNGTTKTSTVTNGVFYPKNNDKLAVGYQTGASGSPFVVNTSEGITNLIYQTDGGGSNGTTGGGALPIDLPSNTKAKRLTWVQRR